jgi:hypothetical protein
MEREASKAGGQEMGGSDLTQAEKKKKTTNFF